MDVNITTEKVKQTKIYEKVCYDDYYNYLKIIIFY